MGEAVDERFELGGNPIQECSEALPVWFQRPVDHNSEGYVPCDVSRPGHSVGMRRGYPCASNDACSHSRQVASRRYGLLVAATDAFAEDGAGVALDAIAARAGVGIGTLYRHFPNREALIVAAYRHEVEQLCSSAPTLLADLPPDQALHGWMERFAQYVATKRGMGSCVLWVPSGTCRWDRLAGRRTPPARPARRRAPLRRREDVKTSPNAVPDQGGSTDAPRKQRQRS